MKKILCTIIIIILLTTFIIKDANIPVHAKEKNKCTDIYQCENIVFLGDSITDWYPIKSIFGDLPIVRSGVAGYKTTDILDRMQEMVYSYNPTKVFILIGTNDLKYKEDDVEEVSDNIKDIINKIKENRPKAEIYYEAIYPVNQNLGPAAEERHNEEIDEVNEIMKDFCKKNGVTYIDMKKELADDDGNFDKKFTDDGLHPNNLGYARISQVLLKYIYNVQE